MNTPQGNHDCNISDKEITATSAKALLDMTRSYPDTNHFSPPRCYNQCVDDPKCDLEDLAETQKTGVVE